LKRRFVKAETTLFRVRYETDDSLERAEFLQAQGAEASNPIKDDEKERLKDDLIAATPGVTATNLKQENFIKVCCISVHFWSS
jgi:DNA primase large subunit